MFTALSTAQKVRLWFMLGLSILNGVGIIALGAIPGYELATGSGDGWYFIILATFIANVTLGSISVYRFLHPQQPPAHALPYQQPLSPMPPQTPYQNPYPAPGYYQQYPPPPTPPPPYQPPPGPQQ